MNARTTPPPVPRKKPNRTTPVIVACAFGPWLILLIAFLSYRVSNASAIRRLEAEIKRKGEPLTLADLAAAYPPIPDEDNGAVLLMELWKGEDPEFWSAFEGARPLPARRVISSGVTLPILGDGAQRIRRTTNLQATDVLAADAFLKERKEYFESVRHALRKSRFRFPIVLTDGYRVVTPHLSQMKREAHNFQIEAFLATELGNVEGAIAALENTRRVGDALAEEPLLISQLVRIACCAMAIEATERLLSFQPLSSDQLRNLIAVVEQAKMSGALRLTYISQRAVDLSIFELPAEREFQPVLSSNWNPDEGSNLGRRANDRLSISIYRFFGIKHSDRRLFLETYANAIALADRDDVEALKETESVFMTARSKAARWPQRILCCVLLAAQEKVATRLARLEARRRTAIVTIAAEQYRLANNGRLPEHLRELVPEYLSQLPVDPFDGEPLRYKILPTGFVIYSVGPDRVDDGGTEPPQAGSQQNFDVTFIVER